MQHTSGRSRPERRSGTQVGAHPGGRPRVEPGRIELRIGELALYGFDHVDPTQLGAIVRQELSRLLTENGTPSSLIQAGNMAILEGEAFTAESGADADVIGVQIARAIYRGFPR